MKSRDDYAGEVVTRLHPGEGKIRRKACLVLRLRFGKGKRTSAAGGGGPGAVMRD
jgi:hypothetical protein